jgi:hypothetical protein
MKTSQTAMEHLFERSIGQVRSFFIDAFVSSAFPSFCCVLGLLAWEQRAPSEIARLDEAKRSEVRFLDDNDLDYTFSCSWNHSFCIALLDGAKSAAQTPLTLKVADVTISGRIMFSSHLFE